MNKAVLHITFLFAFCISWNSVFSQEKTTVDDRWQQMEDRIEYRPPNRKSGPSNNYNSPPGIQSKPSGNAGDLLDNKPSKEEIKQSREQLYENSPGGGVKKKIRDSESSSLDDISTPDVEPPSIDSPDWDSGNFSEVNGTFWKVLLIIICVLLVAFLLYHIFFKEKSKKETKVAPVDYTVENLDPRNIQPKQLETDLDKAIRTENYRLAIRIYYTMTLKALIEKDWIVWGKKKTNFNYLLEMQGRPEKQEFETGIKIFEWVWYGKYEPKPGEFSRAQQFFNRFYKKLKSE